MARKSGARKQSTTCALPHSEALALLLGAILGDGNIDQMARCQRLDIACFEGQEEWINELVGLIQSLFGKRPSLYKARTRCVHIRLYKQGISTLVGLPTGSKKRNRVRIPAWIFSDTRYLIPCLRGLFETDGCFCAHHPNYVYVVEFRNYNPLLLEDCERALRHLDFTPQRGLTYVRLARKEEIHRFCTLTRFLKADLSQFPPHDRRSDGRNGEEMECALPGCRVIIYRRRSELEAASNHYCSREHADLGRRKVNRPPRDELQQQIETLGNWSALGRHYGVSDNAVRKWAKQYGLLNN